MIWNDEGIIPPVWGQGMDQRSPLPCSIADFIQAFAISPHRAKLAKGFLDYRDQLRQCVGKSAIQWADGSFVEHIEKLEARDPKDIDVLTIFMADDVDADHFAAQKLNDLSHLRTCYHVDAYYLPLGQQSLVMDIRMLTYWYAQWSHRRDHKWKGFIQLFLHDDDEQARHLLMQMHGGNHG